MKCFKCNNCLLEKSTFWSSENWITKEYRNAILSSIYKLENYWKYCRLNCWPVQINWKLRNWKLSGRKNAKATEVTAALTGLKSKPFEEFLQDLRKCQHLKWPGADNADEMKAAVKATRAFTTPQPSRRLIVKLDWFKHRPNISFLNMLFFIGLM